MLKLAQKSTFGSSTRLEASGHETSCSPTPETNSYRLYQLTSLVADEGGKPVIKPSIKNGELEQLSVLKVKEIKRTGYCISSPTGIKRLLAKFAPIKKV